MVSSGLGRYYDLKGFVFEKKVVLKFFASKNLS